jgi:hypothetical protein
VALALVLGSSFFFPTRAGLNTGGGIQDWQGEWGQWSAAGSADVFHGASISIQNCDAAAGTCRFHFDSKSSESSCSQLSDAGSILRVTGLTARAQFQDYHDLPSDCVLDLELRDTPRGRELRMVKQSGKECVNNCTEDKLNFPVSYPFRSAVSYPLLSVRECFADARASRAIWCVDPQVQELDRALKTLGEEIDHLTYTQQMYKARPVREEAWLSGCEHAANVTVCLRSAYSNAVTEYQGLKKAAVEAHEKDEQALRTPGNPQDATALIGRVEGVYKQRFENALVDGSSFTSENILEIVRVAPDAVYVNTHLVFYNAHTCDVSGLARFSQKGVFVFRDPDEPTDPGDEPCVLQFEASTDQIRILDPTHACKPRYCGARGGFVGAAFAMSARRPIRYMTLIKKSAEYKEAIAQLNK